MSRRIQSLIDRLKKVDPGNPKLAKLQKFEIIYQGMLEEGWFRLTDDAIAEAHNEMYDTLNTTSPETPNVLIYAIIWVGMHGGGWLRLTDKQREVIRQYVFNRDSMSNIAERNGITYDSVRDTYLGGVEKLRINAIRLVPDLADIFLSEDVKRKSVATQAYRDADKERMLYLRQTEAFANRKIVPGPGRGKKGRRINLIPPQNL